MSKTEDDDQRFTIATAIKNLERMSSELKRLIGNAIIVRMKRNYIFVSSCRAWEGYMFVYIFASE